MSHVETRLANHNIVLPQAPKPLGNFAPALIDRDYLYISGQISLDSDNKIISGKIGDTATIAQGVDASRNCAIGILARAKSALGDLDKIEQLIKLGTFINAAEDFEDHPTVANGASDFLSEVFGPRALNHVRFAIGCSSLPKGALVEIEAVFRISK